jgi:hypothetical protein
MDCGRDLGGAVRLCGGSDAIAWKPQSRAVARDNLSLPHDNLPQKGPPPQRPRATGQRSASGLQSQALWAGASLPVAETEFYIERNGR